MRIAPNIEVANMSDIIEILELQMRAYRSEAEIYDDYSITPLVETPQEIQKEFKRYVFLKAMHEKSIVGSVRGFLDEGTVHIGRLIVEPDLQNHGIGTALMYFLEAYFPFAKRFELFTGHKSARNLRLYSKLGYSEFKRIPINNSLVMVYLEKCRR